MGTDNRSLRTEINIKGCTRWESLTEQEDMSGAMAAIMKVTLNRGIEKEKASFEKRMAHTTKVTHLLS